MKYTIGRQGTIILVWNGKRVDIQDVTNFRVVQETHRQRIEPLNRPPMEINTPAGWRGSFTIDRGSNALDVIFNEDELNFWNNKVIPTGTLYTYIEESDGFVSKYEYSSLSLVFSDGGNFQSDVVVRQTVNFFASQRKSIA